jgi:beta-glucosidase/6-phospho-beta-glucosidase/beta-galactosidase
MTDLGRFAWGVGFASTQAEGAAEHSDWRDWERQGRAPYSADGNGFATDHRGDFRLFAEAGLTDVRLCPEWARLEPENGRVDLWVVEHYQQVLSAAVDAGLRPWVALADRSLPGWFALDERGFRDRQARSYFWPRHVERCAELFGEWAHAWVPIVAPLRLARGGYLTGTAPPGRQDPRRFLDTLAGLHLGLGEAWRVLRGGAPVVAAFDVAEVRPADREPTTRARARRAESLHWLWTEGFRDGQLTLPDQGARAAPALRDACDAIGLVVVDRVTVAEEGAWGAQAVPEDVGGLVRRAAEEGPELPLVVLGQRVIDPERLEATLTEVRGLREEVRLTGWFAEPAVDGYEWEAGFGPRLGLWDRDRNPRPQLDLLREVLQDERPPLDLSGAVELGETAPEASPPA